MQQLITKGLGLNMTRVYKIKFVDLKSGKKDIACVDATSQEEARAKLAKRFREVAISSVELVFKPRTSLGSF